MGIIFTGQIPAITGPVQLEVPTATYSGLSDETDASASINPYTNQGPGADGSGQTASQIVEDRGGVATDEFFDDVRLLFPYDSNNADVKTGLTGNNLGGATISSFSKFGEGSLHLPSESGRVTYANNDSTFRIGGGDFTIELWVYPTQGSVGGNPRIILDTRNGTGQRPWMLARNTDGTMRITTGNDNRSTTSVAPVNDWTHFAVTRSGSTMRLFFNGALETTVEDTAVLDGLNSTAFLGKGQNTSNTSSFNYQGYIDEFRITVGVARYTASFDVQTSPFPTQ